MVPWYDLIREITLWLRDCPEPTMARRLQLEAADFYRQTWTWRTEVVEIAPAVVAGQRDYPVIPPAGTDVVGVAHAWVDGRPLDMTPGRGDTAPGTIGADWTIGVADAGTVRLTPAPSAPAGVLRAVLALVPNASAIGIPYELWQEHRRALVAKTVARLASMPGKPWADPRLALEMAREATSEQSLIAHQQGLRATARRPALRVRPADGWSAGRRIPPTSPLASAISIAAPAVGSAIPGYTFRRGDAWTQPVSLSQGGADYPIGGRQIVAELVRVIGGSVLGTATVVVTNDAGGDFTLTIPESLSAGLQAGTGPTDPSGIHWLVVRLDGPSEADRITLTTIRLAVVA